MRRPQKPPPKLSHRRPRLSRRAYQTETYQVVVQPDATGGGYKLVSTGYGKQTSTETTIWRRCG